MLNGGLSSSIMVSPCLDSEIEKKEKEKTEEKQKEEICPPLILKRFSPDGNFVITSKQDNDTV